ncbi:MAG: peptidoglycan D,D-transpeptidase FtsI family protein [Gammaproteobacteria bacterium]
MRRGVQATFIAWRYYLITLVILLIVAGLIARLIDLAVIKRHFLQIQGDARVLRVVNTPSFRGMITDRNGYPLAISTSVFSIWVNPKDFSATQEDYAELSKLLKIKKSDIQRLIQQSKNKNREFTYLKREVSPEVAVKIKALRIPGLYQLQGYKRFYPEGEVAAHVIGFTNVDDQGQEGLELAYNDWLSGQPGKDIVVKDRLGRVVSEVKQIQQQKPGSDITLSINRRIQYLAYRELLEGVKKNLAASGSVVVLDVKTGEVLAMVNQPSFNPNNRADTKLDALRNRAVTDTFEPGSTIKAFTVATALDSGKYKPNTIIDTYPGWLRVGHNLVKDEHSKGPMTVTQILQISSNVGATKMILTLPPNSLWHLLHRVGFGEETGIYFPGERSGALVKRDVWPPFALATLSFGYGISATTLQLARAYATIANEGIKIPLSLLKLDKPPEGKRVMDERIAKQMLIMLESVVAKGGTAEAANIPGYHVAGKTGTAKMVGDHGYEKHHYTSSFVGVAPVSHPRILVAVVIQDPQGKQYYGGLVSGPVFKNIMEGALRMLNIPPDDPEALEAKKPSPVPGVRYHIPYTIGGTRYLAQ